MACFHRDEGFVIKQGLAIYGWDTGPKSLIGRLPYEKREPSNCACALRGSIESHLIGFPHALLLSSCAGLYLRLRKQCPFVRFAQARGPSVEVRRRAITR